MSAFTDTETSAVVADHPSGSTSLDSAHADGSISNGGGPATVSPPLPRQNSRRRLLIIGAATAAVIAAGAVVLPRLTDGESGDAATPASDDAPKPETVSVTRRDLTEQATANGTIGFGEAVAMQAEGDGIVTAAPEVGDVLRPDDVALRVAGRPLILAQGETPMYRELRRVSSTERDEAGDKIGEQTGDDVRQLQNFLLSIGLDEDGELEADGVFGALTEKAVKKWQAFVGHPATGKVDRSQLLFIAGPVRVESAPRVGAPFADLTVTSTDPVVSATVNSRQRPFFDVGATVQVEIGARTIDGTVSKVTKTTTSDGSAGFSVELTLDSDEVTDLAEPGSAAPGGIESGSAAKLTATRLVADQVLTVPVRALIALAEGGWAVQVERLGGSELTAVTLDGVVDGIAEISGVDEGTKVVVPS